MKTNLPSIAELARLVRAVKSDISSEYRAFEGDETPGIQLTIGWKLSGDWSYQTGDNSYSGGAYGFPHWAVVGVYPRSNSRAVARDLIDQLAEVSEYERSQTITAEGAR